MENRPYTIDLPKLRLGSNAFAFAMEGAFFRQVENSLVQEAEVQVTADIEKTAVLLDARFSFSGTVGLMCDRCVQPFSYPISVEHRIVYGLEDDVENQPQEADEIIFIGRNLQTLNLSQDFYDIVSLQVPLRKVPCDQADFACLADARVRSILETGLVDEKEDPRWEALKDLKDPSKNTDN